MLGILDLYQLVEADAKRDLSGYLKPYIRSEFYNKVNLDSILNDLAEDAGNGQASFSPAVFKEDVIAKYIEDGQYEDLQSLLTAKVESYLEKKDPERYEADDDLLTKDAKNIVVPREVLPEALRDHLMALKDDLGKLVYSHLRQALIFRAQTLITDRKKEKEFHKEVNKEDVEQGEGGEPITELTMEQQFERAKKEQSWEEGLFDDIKKMFKEKVPADKQDFYTLILMERIVGIPEKKTLEEIAAEAKIEPSTVMRNEKKVFDLVKEFLKQSPKIIQKLGPKKVFEKEVPIPDYKEVLKDESAKQSFKDFIKEIPAGGRGDTGAVSDATRKILLGLADNKGMEEMIKEIGTSQTNIDKLKSTKFKNVFKDWYNQELADIRKACERIQKVLLRNSKIVRKDFVPQKEDDTPAVPLDQHKKMVQKAIDHDEIELTISFSADYDHSDLGSDGKTPKSLEEKADPHFKWEKYVATLDKKQGDHHIQYKYEHDLGADGERKGEGRSELKLDGKSAAKGNEVWGDLDQLMEEKAFPHGIITYENKPYPLPFAVEYVNTKLGRTYKDAKFGHMYDAVYGSGGKVKYPRLFVTDKAHRDRLVHQEKKEIQKRIGPEVRTEGDLKRMITRFEDMLQEELDKGKDADKDTMNDLKLFIVKYKAMLKEEPSEDRSERIKNLMEKAKTFRKKTRIQNIETDIAKEHDEDKKRQLKQRLDKLKEQETPVTADYDTMDAPVDYDSIGRLSMQYKVALKLPDPTTEGSKVIFNLLKKYGESPSMWRSPEKLKTLSKVLRSRILTSKDAELKNLRPEKVSSAKWNSFLEKVESGDLKVEKLDESLRDILSRVKEVLKTDTKAEMDQAEKHFGDYVKDLKVRRDKMKSEKNYAEWVKESGADWVDEEAKVKEVVDYAEAQLKGTAKKFEEAPKQPSVHVLEIGKYQVFERHIAEGKHEVFSQLADRLSNSPMEPARGTDLREYVNKLSTIYEGIRTNYDALEKDIKKIREDAKGLEKSEKLQQNLLQKETEFKGLSKDLENINKQIRGEYTIPALGAANALDSYLGYFSNLFNKYARFIESREDTVEASEWSGPGPRPPEQETKDIEKGEEKKKTPLPELRAKMKPLRDEIVNIAEKISGIPMKAKHDPSVPGLPDVIPTHIKTLRTKLDAFIKGMGDIQGMVQEDIEKRTPKESAEQKSHNEAYIEGKYPVKDLMDKARGIVKKVSEKDEDSAKIAQGEFEDLINGLAAGFRKTIEKKDLAKLADTFGMSSQDILDKMETQEKILAEEALEAFTKGWESELKAKERTRTDLGTKDSSNYEAMAEFVDAFIPELAELTPPEDKTASAESEDIKKFIADRGLIKKIWEQKPLMSDERVRSYYKTELNKWGIGGGSEKAKGRHRKKEIKPPPPEMTYEKIKHHIIKGLKGSSAEDLVHEPLMEYIDKVKQLIKAGEYFSADDIIIALVDIAKSVGKWIPQVSAYSTKIERPSGRSDLGGKPDIAVDSEKELKEIADKVKEVYSVINELVAPDKMGVPLQSLKDWKDTTITKKLKLRNYFPRGLMDTVNHFQGKKIEELPEGYERIKGEPPKKEPEYTPGGHKKYLEFIEKNKTAEGSYDFPSQMSTNIAEKFIGANISEDDLEAILS